MNNRDEIVTGGSGPSSSKVLEAVVDRNMRNREFFNSRDALKQHAIQQAGPFLSHPDVVRYPTGDVRDERRPGTFVEVVVVAWGP
jgi:hypothetical protein